MINLIVCLTGLSPILMHNVQLANPISPFTKALKELTLKKKKTDADHLEISFREWLGGLYLHESSGRPCVTGEQLKAAWCGGGRKLKLGKDLGVALLCPDSYVIAGPGCEKDLREAGAARALFDAGKSVDVRAVRNQQSRVMRTRPVFRQWAITAEVLLDEEIINQENALQALRIAGSRVGIGDYRPETGGAFGRFTVEAA